MSFYRKVKRTDDTGEMNPVSRTGASLVVLVLAITDNDWVRDSAYFVNYVILELYPLFQRIYLVSCMWLRPNKGLTATVVFGSASLCSSAEAAC